MALPWPLCAIGRNKRKDDPVVLQRASNQARGHYTDVRRAGASAARRKTLELKICQSRIDRAVKGRAKITSERDPSIGTYVKCATLQIMDIEMQTVSVAVNMAGRPAKRAFAAVLFPSERCRRVFAYPWAVAPT